MDSAAFEVGQEKNHLLPLQTKKQRVKKSVGDLNYPDEKKEGDRRVASSMGRTLGQVMAMLKEAFKR